MIWLMAHPVVLAVLMLLAGVVLGILGTLRFIFTATDNDRYGELD